MPRLAPVTSPAMIMPSIRRCGRLVMMKRSLMVPGSLSSALQTIYLTGSGCLRTRSHFMLVGNPAPPMPFAVSVGIGFAGHALLFGMRLVNVVAANGAAADLLGSRRGNFRKNMIVDGNSRSVVAPAKAGDVANLHVFRARIRESALKI